ncbi:MAG: YtxH domain-containing protein [Dehalococcoidia bacterium]|nr:YtxH domain-containing protein [Dehalococcoidia bacterium]
MLNKESAEGFGAGLLLGAVIGASIGILYAPHSGKETRVIISEKVHDATLKAEKIVEEAREKAENIIKEAKAKMHKQQ